MTEHIKACTNINARMPPDRFKIAVECLRCAQPHNCRPLFESLLKTFNLTRGYTSTDVEYEFAQADAAAAFLDNMEADMKKLTRFHMHSVPCHVQMRVNK